MVKELLALEVGVFISHVEFNWNSKYDREEKSGFVFRLENTVYLFIFRSKAPLPHVYEQSPVIVGVIVGGDMRGRSRLKY